MDKKSRWYQSFLTVPMTENRQQLCGYQSFLGCFFQLSKGHNATHRLWTDDAGEKGNSRGETPEIKKQ